MTIKSAYIKTITEWKNKWKLSECSYLEGKEEEGIEKAEVRLL